MFAWDPNKAEINLVKHGVSFQEACTVFHDTLAVCFPDELHSEIEERLVLVGYSAEGRLLFVSHVDFGDNIRIISARSATAFESKRHEEHT